PAARRAAGRTDPVPAPAADAEGRSRRTAEPTGPTAGHRPAEPRRPGRRTEGPEAAGRRGPGRTAAARTGPARTAAVPLPTAAASRTAPAAGPTAEAGNPAGPTAGAHSTAGAASPAAAHAGPTAAAGIPAAASAPGVHPARPARGCRTGRHAEWPTSTPAPRASVRRVYRRSAGTSGSFAFDCGRVGRAVHERVDLGRVGQAHLVKPPVVVRGRVDRLRGVLERLVHDDDLTGDRRHEVGDALRALHLAARFASAHRIAHVRDVDEHDVAQRVLREVRDPHAHD